VSERSNDRGKAAREAGRSRELERDERAVAPARPPGVSPGLADRFRDVADRLTRLVGSPFALLAAITLIVVWALTGPVFGFSDSWQLIINTTTTIITFLMVFVIQTSQNRDARAIQLKLDELIRSHSEARNELMRTEKEPEEMLTALEEEFEVTAGGQRQPRRQPSRTRSGSSSRSGGGSSGGSSGSSRSKSRTPRR
jgi:low affinity Fe/Cu permease